MFAILAAVLFAIALIMDLADATGSITSGTLVTAGLLSLALHLAGVGAGVRIPRGGRRWSMRR